MSTRANIIIRDPRFDPDILYFYRHSDGYPDGPIPEHLDQLVEWLNEERIRDDVMQMSGWLIILGHFEYRDHYQRWDSEPWMTPRIRRAENPDDHKNYLGEGVPGGKESGSGWKASAYEPTPWGIHGDVEHVYVLDVSTKAWHRMSPEVARHRVKQWEEARQEGE